MVTKKLRPPLFAAAETWAPTDIGFNTLWPEASGIEGWLAQSQARALYRAAGFVPIDQWIIEMRRKGTTCVPVSGGAIPWPD